jgi:hypothetical protein
MVVHCILFYRSMTYEERVRWDAERREDDGPSASPLAFAFGSQVSKSTWSSAVTLVGLVPSSSSRCHKKTPVKTLATIPHNHNGWLYLFLLSLLDSIVFSTAQHTAYSIQHTSYIIHHTITVLLPYCLGYTLTVLQQLQRTYVYQLYQQSNQ